MRGDCRAGETGCRVPPQVGRTELVYRGSTGAPESIYAGFPSLVRFDDEHLICAFTVGATDDSTDKKCWVSRSRVLFVLPRTVFTKSSAVPLGHFLLAASRMEAKRGPWRAQCSARRSLCPAARRTCG